MPRRLSNVESTDLVPETRAWRNGEDVTLQEWIHAVGSFDHMIAYAELFWPDFVEHDGCILRRSGEASYQGFMEQTGCDKEAVEAVINHVHVIELVYQPDSPPTDDQLVYLGRMLKEMVKAKLAKEFPDRQFVVGFEEEGDSVYDYVVTFHQKWSEINQQ